MIRDEVTKAAEGRVALTALALWNFKPSSAKQRIRGPRSR